MGRTAPSYKLTSWKIDDLVKSPLNARVGIEEDPATIELAASLKEHGMLQDPAVRSDGTIIFGTRRVFAAKLAGWKSINCKTYPKTLSTVAEHTLRIEENLRRKDLNPIERARELRSFVDLQPGKAKQRTAAGLLSLTEAALSRQLDLLELPEAWQALVANGTADPTHTRCVAAAGRLHEKLPAELASRYEQLRTSRTLSVKEWEEETDRMIEDLCRPVTSDTSKAVLPQYAPHRGELDIRQWKGKPVAFNVPLWQQLSYAPDAKSAAGPVEDHDDGRKPPELWRRQRIALHWFNHRLLSYFHRHPGAAMKWLPLLEMKPSLMQEAISAARGLKEWSSDNAKLIPIIKRVGVAAGATFLSNYLQELARIAIAGRILVVKDFHFAKQLAAAIGIDYAKEFPTSLTEDDQKEIVNVYGSLPQAGKFPRGMDPRSMTITKATA